MASPADIDRLAALAVADPARVPELLTACSSIVASLQRSFGAPDIESVVAEQVAEALRRYHELKSFAAFVSTTSRFKLIDQLRGDKRIATKLERARSYELAEVQQPVTVDDLIDQRTRVATIRGLLNAFEADLVDAELRVWQLRRAEHTFEVIGAELGVDRSTACRMWHRMAAEFRAWIEDEGVAVDLGELMPS